MFSPNNNEYYYKNDNSLTNKHFFNEKMDLIKEITNQKMNDECFDCLKVGPKYISINNGIFLCEKCAKIHKSFPENISFVIDNNLNLLSNNYLKYLYYGGNKNLDFFINYDYPGLQNYSPEVLYKTQAMIYYREELKCRIEGKPKPICPNNVMAYKIVSENGLINIRDKKKYKTNNLKNNYDIINNYYNNYNNTYNTYNNYNYIKEDHDDKNKKISFINKNKVTKYCSVVNNIFFSEMKNLFGKKSIENDKDKNKNNNMKYSSTNIKSRKLEISKSYDNVSKLKNKRNNCIISNGINKSLTYKLDESLNNLSTKRKSDALSERRKSNKFEFLENKDNSKFHSSFSQKYLSPTNNSIKIDQRKNSFNKVYIKNINLKKKKLKIEISQNSKYEDLINEKLIDEKIYESKENIFNSFNINKKLEDKNLSFEIIGNNDLSYKNYLFNKNERNNANDINFKINKNKTQLEKKPYYKNKNLYLNNLEKENLNYNSYNYINENVYQIKVKKKNYTNINYDKMINKRKPIKVNLNNNNSKNYTNINNEKNENEIKKKALKDKKEQEKLEDEHLHNLIFKRKESDLLTNIVFLNNNK